jgi:hypothetical protein
MTDVNALIKLAFCRNVGGVIVVLVTAAAPLIRIALRVGAFLMAGEISIFEKVVELAAM